MEIHDFTSSVMLHHLDEVRIEHITNQRFTMKEIGEIEIAQQFDSDFNYKRSLINNVISRTNASGKQCADS